MENRFYAKAWNNGGDGFGLKLTEGDRDRFLRREWGNIVLHLPHADEPIVVNTNKASMWVGTCRELIHKEIGTWLKTSRRYPWKKGQPPRVMMEHIGDREFKVIGSPD